MFFEGGVVTERVDDIVRRHLRQNGQVSVPKKDQPEYFQEYGLRPDVVVDVGVHDGTPLLYKAFPDAKFVLIDPRVESEGEMRARHAPGDYDFHPCAAGAEGGALELRIPILPKGETPAMAGFRKILGPMGRRVTRYETRTVPVRRLDDIMDGYSGRVGLKIDTEGFELDVLQGAKETLQRCDFVMVELSVTHRFEDVAPPSLIFAELARAGLEFRDVLRTTGDGRGGPRPRLFDVLFTRWESTV